MASLPLVGLLIVVAVIVPYAVLLYNGLVAVRHNVAKAWANVDVVLKQRHDEIPKLIATCKEYRQFEQEILANVVRARTAVQDAREQRDIAALGAAEGNLRSSLGSLFAVAEAYPVLKTNDNFMQLQSRISELESTIADRRELYNESVNINNVRVQQFPASLIAKRLGFGEARLLQFEVAETTDVDLKALLSS